MKRLAIQTEDWLRYHPTVRAWLGRGQLLRARLRRPGNDQETARLIQKRCLATRLASPAAVPGILARTLDLVQRLDPKRLDWSEFVSDIAERSVLKAVILKPYLGPREKGVLFVSFEGQWLKILVHADLPAFAARYTLVLSSSGSPHHLINYLTPSWYPDPVFILLSNQSDLDVLPRISDRYRIVPLYASSWVHPELFQPVPRAERTIDLIMVANWAKFKRHHVLFEALRHLPKTLRLLLIGQNQDGRTAETIRAEARLFGVPERFRQESNLQYEEVARAFCQAKASVILSRREGSNVAVAESLMADTPAGVLENAELGSRAFINAETGVLLRERTLAPQLLDLVENGARFQPRRWAEANISCWKSTATLNAALKENAQQTGQDWTQDLWPLCWRPDPVLVRSEDRPRMEMEQRDILTRFGLQIGRTDPA